VRATAKIQAKGNLFLGKPARPAGELLRTKQIGQGEQTADSNHQPVQDEPWLGRNHWNFSPTKENGADANFASTEIH
jgi:hypothetical protein